MTDPRTSRTWYLLGAGLIVSAVATLGFSFGQYVSTVEGMQRVVMPGRAQVTLPIGPSTLYAESRSVVDGKPYAPPADLRFHCGLEPSDGTAFARSTKDASYAYGDFAGASAFEVKLSVHGTFNLVCDSPAPFVMAIGSGTGTWKVIAVVGAVPFLAGVIWILFVYVKRLKQRR